MLDFERLDDKAVLITGAADGIGLAMAEAFSAGGARVFLADIAQEKLAEQAKRLGAASAPCDVTDRAAVESMVERAWREIGPIDLLCANAGVIDPGPLLEASREAIDFQFGVNVWGVLDTVRAFVAKLREAGRAGHLVLTGSEHSLSNPPYLSGAPCAVYNMTKHAVLAMGDQLRGELAEDRIGVSVLCPGPIVSGLGDNSAAYRPERFGEGGPIDLSGVTKEQMETIVSLYRPASHAADCVLAGLRRGAFVIPTHAHEKEDATGRFREIERGFEIL